MRIIVSVILLAFITVSCGTNKRVYAPPFEEEETETEAGGGEGVIKSVFVEIMVENLPNLVESINL